MPDTFVVSPGLDIPGAQRLGTIAITASHAQPTFDNSRDEATIKRFKLQSLAKKLLPTKRVSNCLRLLVPGAQSVDVMYIPERESAHFHNLRTCDSVWDCPVCAAKITERRRVELMLAIARAYEDGYTPVLVTWTLRHHRGDKLTELLTALLESHRALKSGRGFQTLKSDYGWVGSVKSLEATNGIHRVKNNGWHPHLHELVFLEPIAAGKLNGLEGALRERWAHMLDKRGYDATWERGVRVQDSDAAVIEYVAKWGHEPKNTRWSVERELTKSPTKSASENGATPFQLLEMYGEGDEEAGRLFQEYSASFYRRAQLIWSRGLHELLGLGEEQSDAEIVSVEDDSTELLGALDRHTWYKLLHLPRDVRGEILCVARRGDAGELEAFVSAAIGERVSLRNSIDECNDLMNRHKTDDENVTKLDPEQINVSQIVETDKGVNTSERLAAGVGEVQRGIDFPVDVGSWETDPARWLEAEGRKRVRRPRTAAGAVAAADECSSNEAARRDRGG